MEQNMVDMELLEKAFRKGKRLSDVLSSKKDSLEKNRFIIALPDGTIPAKYQKNFAKLQEEVSRLGKDYGEYEENLEKIVFVYVQDTAMGNMFYEPGVEGTDYFFGLFRKLFEANKSLLKKAVSTMNLDQVLKVTESMRERYLAAAFDSYVPYSERLSINR